VMTKPAQSLQVSGNLAYRNLDFTLDR